jgi:hypothetical protein
MDTWYVAPYPEEYSQYSTLYICEFCMKYMKTEYIAGRHKVSRVFLMEVTLKSHLFYLLR